MTTDHDGHTVAAGPVTVHTGRPTLDLDAIRARDVPDLLAEVERLRRVNGEWAAIHAHMVDGLAERGVNVRLGDRYSRAALAEIDRLKVQASNYAHDRDEARRERDEVNRYREQQAATIRRQGDTIRDLTRERDEARGGLDRLRAGIADIIRHHESAVATAGASDCPCIPVLRALLDGPTPAPNTTQPLYCAECGTALDINGRIAICPDCPRLFCGIGCQRTHRKLGTCPDHADGVLAGPASSPTADQPASGEGQDSTGAQDGHRG